MNIPILWTHESEADLKEARQWYHRIRPGLGTRFAQAIEATIARIAENPLQFPIVHRTLRRAGVRRFPFGLFFHIEPERIIVIACFHAKRNPTHWQAP